MTKQNDYEKFIQYLKNKCSKIRHQFYNAPDKDKKYYLPRKEWAEITIKEIEHFESCKDSPSLYHKDVETRYEPERLKEELEGGNT